MTGPSLRHVFDLDIELGDTVDLGPGPAGHRHLIPILGGHVEGPGPEGGPAVQGTVLAGGADHATERRDGVWELDARYGLRLRVDGHDDALVTVSNRGFWVGDDDAPLVYYLTTPLFSTEHPALTWLSRTVFVGEARETGHHRISIRVHAVEHRPAPER